MTILYPYIHIYPGRRKTERTKKCPPCLNKPFTKSNIVFLLASHRPELGQMATSHKGSWEIPGIPELSFWLQGGGDNGRWDRQQAMSATLLRHMDGFRRKLIMEVAGTFDTKFVAESSSFLVNQCLFSPAPLLAGSPSVGRGIRFWKKGCFLHFLCIKWRQVTYFWSMSHRPMSCSKFGKPFAS